MKSIIAAVMDSLLSILLVAALVGWYYNRNQTTLNTELVKQGHAIYKVDKDGKPSFHLLKIESGKVIDGM